MATKEKKKPVNMEGVDERLRTRAGKNQQPIYQDQRGNRVPVFRDNAFREPNPYSVPVWQPAQFEKYPITKIPARYETTKEGAVQDNYGNPNTSAKKKPVPKRYKTTLT